MRYALIKKDIQRLTIAEYQTRFPQEVEYSNNVIAAAKRRGAKWVFIWMCPDALKDTLFNICQPCKYQSPNKWAKRVLYGFLSLEEKAREYYK